jgi:hypothetical protein
LTDDLGLAVNALAIAGLVVGVAVDLLGGEAWHIQVIPQGRKQINREMFRGRESEVNLRAQAYIYGVLNPTPTWGVGPARGVRAACQI